MYSAHVSRVRSLYKRALRTAYDWAGRRDVWRPYALDIRDRFEQNRKVDSLTHREKLLEEAEKELTYYSHPDPYKCKLITDVMELRKDRSLCSRRRVMGEIWREAEV